MAVHILQLLCPRRHAIVALAFCTDGAGDRSQVKAQVLDGMQKFGIEFRCGLCCSRDLSFEETPTPFDTLDEATPVLLELQRQNLITRTALEHQRRAAQNN